MTEATLRWWPKNKPLPDGWRESANTHPCHHDHWSRLIEEIGPASGPQGDKK